MWKILSGMVDIIAPLTSSSKQLAKLRRDAELYEAAIADYDQNQEKLVIEEKPKEEIKENECFTNTGIVLDYYCQSF